MHRVFAAEEGPHISLTAEPLFEIAGFTITNSMIYGLLISVFIIVLSLHAAKKIGLNPSKGVSQFYEMFASFMISMLEDIFKSREKALKYAPIFGTFFLFIVLTNLTGLLPLVGPGFTYNDTQLFRPFTADLNGTIALSVVAIVIVQYLSIKESGWLGHIRHYFTDKPWNPINFFIGILEVFGEVTRVVSLSLRLFLNTAVGEILISVFAFVGGSGSSLTVLPIAVFEMLVALIQAYVFTVLAATYLGLAISHGHDGHEDDHSGAKTNLVEAAG